MTPLELRYSSPDTPEAQDKDFKIAIMNALKDQSGWRTLRKPGPLSQRGGHPYELPETEAACTGPAQVCTKWGASGRRKGYGASSIIQKQSSRDNYLQTKI